MRAVLLAAGLGTRLRPITDTIPKCLVPIHGRPLLDYWLDILFEGGIERVLINTHYLADLVVDHIAKSPWRGKISHVHEDELLGTGGTLNANKDFLGDDAVLVAHADNLSELDVTAMRTCHESRPDGVAITMALFRTDRPETCGIVTLDKDKIVREFVEKPKRPTSNLANGAVYIFEPEVVAFIDSLRGVTVDLSTQVIPEFIGRILGYEISGYHRDIGSQESLEKAQTEFRPRR